MNNKVADVLIDLASNPDRLDAFRSDPQAALAAYGLTPDECETLRGMGRHSDAPTVFTVLAPQIQSPPIVWTVCAPESSAR